MRVSHFELNETAPLTGKVFLITGGTGGIGAEAVLALAHHPSPPAAIYFTGRSEARAKALIARCPSPQTVSFIAADQGSLASVKRAVETFLARSDRLDVLIANAGIMDVPGKSEDGYEIQFGTNVVAHALFFRLLLSTLLKSADPRFVSLTSELHTATGKTGLELSELRSDAKGTLGAGLAGYDRSKFGNLVYGQECARRFPTITVANIHPGIVKTDLISELSFLKRTFINVVTYFWALTPEQGAYSELWAATAPRKDIKSGAYYVPVGQEKATKLKAADPTEGKNLYDWMETELAPFLAKAFV